MGRSKVEIGFGRDGATVNLVGGAPEVYEGKLVPWKALVDTGASMSVVSPYFVELVDPPNIGHEVVGRAGGITSVHLTYLVRIKLDGGDQSFEFEAVEIAPASPQVDLILGRDFLRKVVFHWDGPKWDAWIDS